MLIERSVTQASKRRDRMAKPQQDAFDRAIEWAQMGTNDDATLAELAEV
jgi:hypothetical protein